MEQEEEAAESEVLEAARVERVERVASVSMSRLPAPTGGKARTDCYRRLDRALEPGRARSALVR